MPIGEELLLRKAKNARYVESLDKRRKDTYAREQHKWHKMEEEEKHLENYWKQQRDIGEKSKRNSSKLPYNMITLQYNNGKDGDNLRYIDDSIRYRASLRAQNMMKHGGATYNLITHEDSIKPYSMSRPEASEYLK